MFTPTGMAWRLQRPMLMGGGHSVKGGGQGAKMRCGQDLRLWVSLLLGAITHVRAGSW